MYTSGRAIPKNLGGVGFGGAFSLGFGFGIGHVDFGFGICGDLLLKPLSCVFLVVVGVLAWIDLPLRRYHNLPRINSQPTPSWIHSSIHLFLFFGTRQATSKPESSAGHLACMQTLIAFLCGGVRRLGRASSMNSLHFGLGFRVKYTGYFVDPHLIINTISIDTNWGSAQVVGLTVIRVWLRREVEEKEVEEQIWYSDRDGRRNYACNITHYTKQRGPVQVPALVILFSYSDYHPGGPSATRPSGLPLLPEQSSSEQGLQRPVKSRQSPKYRIRSLIRLRARISSSIRGIIRTRTGALTIYGYTNTTTFTSNSTTLFHWLASTAGSDDASGTLWIHDNFGMYIVNVIALSQDGSQVYLKGIIESPELIFSEGYVWSELAKVVLKSTTLDVALNPALWSLWDGEADSIDDVLNADYNTTSLGASNLERAG
ncbi:uncharacterized protein C8R40DRAFT_1182270 [Lentinula edodes]|uniref:uncharacterized protein n=1 Tax=Lentinula edodes TaxID=5353 RepID=UPI001E8E3623|nr:uncharacterized protein C8R40DRAFT_1182270 [Lentinula edodes]KAH7877371.1 hypothetical protein C8R40DRAFT_1182270 [Lentinula edodes]